VDGFIGLGTNLGDRYANLDRGLAGLRRAGLSPLATSSVWETEPVDAPGTPWFWNMAVAVRSDLDPWSILDVLLAVERSAGRVRSRRNAARTLDLDLLLLGDRVVSDSRLELPHPRMWERGFVLEPLAEIASAVRNPRTGRTVEKERSRLPEGAAVRILGPLAALDPSRVSWALPYSPSRANGPARVRR